MANIVITSDTNFITIVFNDKVDFIQTSKIRKSSVRQVNCLTRNDGIELETSSSKNIFLKSADVDSVNGDEDIGNDTILFDKMKALM